VTAPIYPGVTMSDVATSGPPVTAEQLVATMPGVWGDGAPEAAVSWALSQCEDYCGRRFAKQTGDVVVLYPDDLLPDPPILDVTRVEGKLRPYGAITAAWQDLPSWDWTPDGRVYDTSVFPSTSGWAPTWPSLPASLRVTYDHGFDYWPQPVIDTVKALAALFLVNPTGMSELRTAEVMRRWYTGGATANGTSTSGGYGAGGLSSQTGLDRLVLVEVG
jgi:hypothetical protein